jgi:hypothetical protein
MNTQTRTRTRRYGTRKQGSNWHVYDRQDRALLSWPYPDRRDARVEADELNLLLYGEN